MGRKNLLGLEKANKAKSLADATFRKGQHIATHVAYALPLSIEDTRRALAEAPKDQIERLQHSLAEALARRLEFWTDPCREICANAVPF